MAVVSSSTLLYLRIDNQSSAPLHTLAPCCYIVLLQSTAYRHKVELTLEALLTNLKAMQQLLERNGLKSHASFYQ
jgi:hypothetical protein